MNKHARVTALLNKHRVEAATEVNFLVAESYLTEVEERIFYATNNFTAEEIATHQFIRDASRNPVIDPKSACAIVYPISLATIASPVLPKEGAVLARTEIAHLRKFGRPVIFMSLFDFSLGQATRSTAYERELQPIIGQDLKLHRLDIIKPGDRVVQFESTVDLQSNCTLFPLTLTPEKAPSPERRWLFNFVGNTTKEHWPQGMVRSSEQQPCWDRLTAKYRASSFIGSAGQASHLVDGDAFFEVPANSTFTLCPRGIGNWTFRLYEAIHSGSIPVILSDSFLPPMPELDWDSFSLRLPEAQLPQVGEILSGFSTAEIENLQARLADVQRHFSSASLQALWLGWISTHFSAADFQSARI